VRIVLQEIVARMGAGWNWFRIVSGSELWSQWYLISVYYWIIIIHQMYDIGIHTLPGSWAFSV